MFEMNEYAPYTSALEMDLKASVKNVIDRIVAWFKKQIEKFTNLFKKEKNTKKKNIFSGLVNKLKGFFSKAKNAKTAEEAVAAQDEGKDAIKEYTDKLAEIKDRQTDAWNNEDEAALNKANADKKAADAKMAEAWRQNIGENEDDDEIEVDDIEVEDAVESYRKLEKLAGNEELKTAIENVSTNVDTNCTTAEEAAAYLENIETEISKFNRDINTLKAASESMAAYGFDQNRFNTIAAPAVESLRNSFAQVGFTVNAASGIDQEACESMSYFLKTARNIISNKVDELAGNVAEDYAGEASFLATLTI